MIKQFRPVISAIDGLFEVLVNLFIISDCEIFIFSPPHPPHFMSKVDVKVFTIGNELMYAIRYLSTLKGGHGKKVWIEITQFCIKSTEGMDAFLYVRLCGLEKT